MKRDSWECPKGCGIGWCCTHGIPPEQKNCHICNTPYEYTGDCEGCANEDEDE